MAAKKKEFSAKGWKANPQLQAIIDKSGPSGVADYIKTPQFSEKDYIDLMSGLYPHAGVDFGYGYAVKKALAASKFNKATTNDKAVDFTYDVMDLKRDWNQKNPKNKVELDDQATHLRTMFHDYDISSKMIHKLVSEPKYLLEDKYSDKMVPPSQVLKNNKVKPEHLYKYLTHHPEHVDDLIGHEQSDSRLEDMIFDNPENLKHLSNSNIEHFLSKKLKSHKKEDGTGELKLDISPKRAKQIVEHGHDKLYNDALFKTLAAMDPADKKEFIDRKLGITGGESNGLGSWRTDDEALNQQLDGKWDDWKNGSEYDPKFAKRISSSPHLTDEQADHVKRHGNFDEKYELYHNKSVDPKHGAEMFKMWHDNNEAKGYNASQLQEKYQKDKDDVYTLDDIDPDLIDEEDLYENADENARQSYEFSDWVDDNEDDLVKEVELDDKYADNINEDLYNDYDWKTENPNHNAELHKLHTLIYDNTENGLINKDKIAELTGKDITNLGISHLADADGDIHASDLEEHMSEKNPEEINYGSADNDTTMDEHPEYEDRYNEVVEKYKKKQIQNAPYDLYDDHYEAYNDSEKYREAHQEAMNEAREEAAKEHYGELYSSSHQDDRFIPEHLHSHIPNIEEIKKNRKKAIGEPTDMLDKHIPQRSYEHPYGEDQHLHEFVKDYADANGGSIDIGRMHKLMPAQGDAWKKIFGNKGKISSQEIQQKIEAIPKTPYAVSYGKWDSNKMQNLNKKDQIVFRLDHTDESLKPLKEDPELFNTFKKVQEVSKRSGHPTKDNTIAWARVDTTDPDHWMIDEVQSDFGKTVTQYLKDNDSNEKADHVQKISDYHKNWREALINRVLNEAKKHGASKVSTHSAESKSAHTGSDKVHSVYQDSYKKIPRRMGFKPAPGQTLPISDQVKEGVFNKNSAGDKSSMVYQHHDAWRDHMGWADVYNKMSAMHSTPSTVQMLKDKSLGHTNIANKHKERALHYSPEGAESFNMSTEMAPHLSSEAIGQAAEHVPKGTTFTHNADASLAAPPKDYGKQEYHEGHTYNVKPNLIKAMLDIVEDLVKFELIWENTQDITIKRRAQINIDLIKNLLGYEADLTKWERRKSVSIKKSKTKNVSQMAEKWYGDAYGGEKLNDDDREWYEGSVANHGDKWELKELPVFDIHHHHSGHDASEEYINDYAKERQAGSEFPAIIAHPHPEKPGQYKTLDGQHRLLAAKKIGQKTIKAYIPVKKEDSSPSSNVKSIYNKLRKSQVSGKHLQKLEILMKAVPKKIQLQEGRHKGKVVDVVRESKNSSDNAKGFRIKAQTGSSPVRNVEGDPVDTGNAMWLKGRKHKVLGRGIKPSVMSPPTNPWPTKQTTPTPPTPSSSYQESSYESEPKSFKASGKLTSKHAHPEIPHSPKQKALLHGIDLSKIKQQNEGWTSSLTISGFGTNSKKKGVVVKGHLPGYDEDQDVDLGDDYDHTSGGLSTSQREAMYHNLAHNVFGMGEFVPTTSVANHNGTHYSVMEKVPGAGHYEGNRMDRNILEKAKKKGDIQKLAIMNVIMGNSDRHGGNYMISPKGIHLIDHGLTFNYNNNGRDIYDTPAYVSHAYQGRTNSDIKLHPEAVKWLKSLNPKQIDKYLKTHKIDERFKASILGALQAAKKGLKSGHLGGVVNSVVGFHNDNME